MLGRVDYFDVRLVEMILNIAYLVDSMLIDPSDRNWESEFVYCVFICAFVTGRLGTDVLFHVVCDACWKLSCITRKTQYSKVQLAI